MVAPLAEELLFRMILQGWLEKQMPRLRRRGPQLLRPLTPAIPIIASAPIFAAMHQLRDQRRCSCWP